MRTTQAFHRPCKNMAKRVHANHAARAFIRAEPCNTPARQAGGENMHHGGSAAHE